MFSWILQELWVGCEGRILLRISEGQSQEMMELVLGKITFLIYLTFTHYHLIPVSATLTGWVVVFVLKKKVKWCFTKMKVYLIFK